MRQRYRDDLGEPWYPRVNGRQVQCDHVCLIVRAQERKPWRMIDGRMEALYPPPRT